MTPQAAPLTLMGLWRLNRGSCRSISDIVTDARAGTLPGIKPMPSGYGFEVVDEAAALAAMTKKEITQ